MNLLSVIHYPVFGGPHNRNAQLAPLLKQAGVDTTVLLPEDPGNAHERLRSLGVKIVCAPLHRLRITLNPLTHIRYMLSYFDDIATIRRIIREEDIDLVLINGVVNAQAAFAAKKEGVPVVWQILDTRTPQILRQMNGILMRRLANALMCTGELVADEHPGARSFGDRIITFFPPVNTGRFSPDEHRRRAAREILNVPDDKTLVGCVGNVNPQKGYEYFVRAAGKIVAENDATYFRILGSLTETHTDYWHELYQIASDVGLKVGKQFAIVDPGENVAGLLPALDVFMMTSVPRSEGTPTAILEAMSCGIPVVATDVGSISEIVEQDETGRLVTPCDAASIATATLELVSQKDLCRELGENARRLAVQKYDATVCAESHLRAFTAAREHFELGRADPG